MHAVGAVALEKLWSRIKQLVGIEVEASLTEAKESGEFDGESGIYYGTEEPTSETHPIWIDPSGTAATIPTKVSELENDEGYVKQTYTRIYCTQNASYAIPLEFYIDGNNVMTIKGVGTASASVEIPAGSTLYTGMPAAYGETPIANLMFFTIAGDLVPLYAYNGNLVTRVVIPVGGYVLGEAMYKTV